jgi:DNA invertase Pin-like site-specific DNA recombinase
MGVTLKKIIAYYRVSTKKQGVSGLGLDAQKKAVADYAASTGGKIVAEYTEVESGKSADRPKLREAIAHANLAKATLVVAKLDRLARNVEFTATLMNSGIEFIACDNPHANRLSIQLLAAVAENEAIQVSRRTKDALAAAKAKGKKLGSAREGHWEGREHKRGWKKGAKASAKVRSQRAQAAYSFILPLMRQLEEEAEAKRQQLRSELKGNLARIDRKYDAQIEGASEKQATALIAARDAEIKEARAAANYPTYEKIADHLNSLGHQTTAGKPFTMVAVWRILKRYEKVAV